jgi:peptidoglycan/LPS O-acetylase OafA/YrhL
MTAPSRRAALHFFTRVESLRGLAALSVAVFHSIHLLPVDGIAQIHLLTIRSTVGVQLTVTRLMMVVFNGNAAVSLFFVISGFVLTLAAVRDSRATAPFATSFVARRFFRIYPALALNLLLMYCVVSAAAAILPAIIPARFSLRLLIYNLALVDVPINGATWSLAIELLVVPMLLLAYLAIRRGGVSILFIAAVAATVALFSRPRILRVWHVSDYCFMFFLGALLTTAPIKSWLQTLSPRATRLSLCSALLVLIASRFVMGFTSKWALLGEGLAATVLVGLMAHGRDLRGYAWLDARPVRDLGRISYSFYLYHPLFLQILAPALFAVFRPVGLLDRAPLLVGLLVGLVTIPPTLLAGRLSYGWVEQTSNQLGVRIAERFGGLVGGLGETTIVRPNP